MAEGKWIKTFGGKQYHWVSSEDTKAEATKRARLGKANPSVRSVRISPRKLSAGPKKGRVIYDIYARR